MSLNVANRRSTRLLTMAFMSWGLSMTTAVHATPLSADAGLVSLLSGSNRSVGAGEEVTLRFLVLDPQGNPAGADSRVKLQVDEGELVVPEYSGQGLFEVQWTAPQLEASAEVGYKLKVKGDSFSTELEGTLSVRPAAVGVLKVSNSKDSFILGRDQDASLNLDAGDPTVSAEDIQLRISSGGVNNFTALGDGRFTGLFSDPSYRYPHLSIVTAARLDDGQEAFGWQVMKLVGKTSFPVEVAPGATARMKIGEEETPPYVADASGRLKIPIQVQPGIPKATLISIADGQTTETEIDLQVVESRRVALFPAYSSIPLGGETMEIRAVALRPNGDADPDASVVFQAAKGTLSEPKHEGNGIYVATYTSPAEGAGEESISVQLDGSDVQRDSLSMSLLNPWPLGVSLAVEGDVIPASADAFVLNAEVTDASGQGMAGRSLRLDASGAQLSGDVRDLGGGSYQANFEVKGASNVSMNALVELDTSENPQERILVIPSQSRVRPDGLATTPVVVTVVDAYHRPLAGVPVALSADLGEIPTEHVTDEQGLIQTFHTASQGAGLVSITAEADGQSGSGYILQLPDEASGASLALSGERELMTALRLWRGVSLTQDLQREGSEPVAAPAPTAGPLAQLALDGEPELVEGESQTITILAKDQSGLGVSGVKLDIMASGGSSSAPQETEAGRYSITVTPDSGAESVKLAVFDGEGSVSMVKVLSVSAGGGLWGVSPWGGDSSESAPEPAEETTESAPPPPEEPAAEEPAAEEPAAEEPAAEEPAAEEPVSSDSLSTAWLRADLGGIIGGYAYQQQPTTFDGPLWNQAVRLQDLTPAGGARLRVDAYGDKLGLDFLGLQADARLFRYTTIWPNADQTEVPDWVPRVDLQAKGRYSYALNADYTLHAAGSLGFHWGDFITYLMGESEDQLIFQQLGLGAWMLGADLSLESASWRADVGFTQSLRSVERYSGDLELGLSYVLTDGLYATAAYNYTSRSVQVLADPGLIPIGTLDDVSHIATVGVGYEFR